MIDSKLKEYFNKYSSILKRNDLDTFYQGLVEEGNLNVFRCTEFFMEHGVDVLANLRKAIPEYCFFRLSLPKTIKINDSVRSIDRCAFSKCSGVEEVVLPKSLENLDSGAFRSCPSLTKVIFQSTPKNLGAGIFSHCVLLKEVYVPWDEEHSFDGVRDIDCFDFSSDKTVIYYT